MGLHSFRIWVYWFLNCVDAEDKVGELTPKGRMGGCGGDKWGTAGLNVKVLNKCRYHWVRKSYHSLPAFLRPLPPTASPRETQVREISGTYEISSRQAPSKWGSPRVPAARQDFPGASQNTDPSD